MAVLRGARPAALLLVAQMAWAQQAFSPVWIDVPFVHQPREGCGAASILMVMKYWAAQPGVSIAAADDVAVIQRQLYSQQEHGIAPEQMERYLREHGFEVFALNGTWSDLEQQLRKGRPLIIALKPHGQLELHYVVIDGIDTEHGIITMNDPGERKLLSAERARFEQEWSATHDWMLLALPERKAR